ncbi:MAG: hypothetical protein COS94_05720 [Candidatus Hydrogenedentes bacterium CG07_land_8_20_14_0_80_42_17]|nr:MAG: hypothetical protein COS94_05720 [Candidatus Hydrogenedentes bacterium CG07_land_8_20_14_0_80_42_17]
MPRFLPVTSYVSLPKKVDEISNIVTPPFDDLHLALRQERASKSINNFVRFESSRELPGEKFDDDLDVRAKNTLDNFLKEKIISIVDSTYYLLEIVCDGKTVTGFMGMLELNTPNKPDIFEFTDDAIVNDRLQQLESLQIQTAPITIGYRTDEQSAEIIDDTIARIRKNKPIYEFEYPAGSSNTIWKVPRNEAIEPLLSKKKMTLLDGTGRYLAAVKHSNKIKKENKNISQFDSTNFIFAWMIDIEHSQFSFKARHWSLKSGIAPGIDGQNLLIKLEDFFEIERYKFLKPGSKDAELINLLDEIEYVGKLNHTYGLYVGDKAYYAMYLKNAESYERLSNVKKSRRWKRLDYCVLNSIVFDGILGIGWNKPENLEKFSMSISPQRAVSLVDEGFADATFLLNDPLPEHIIEIAESGETISSKCIYLTPKPLVGPILARIAPNTLVEDNLFSSSGKNKLKK